MYQLGLLAQKATLTLSKCSLLTEMQCQQIDGYLGKPIEKKQTKLETEFILITTCSNITIFMTSFSFRTDSIA